MQHIDGNAGSFDHFCRGQFASPGTAVNIAEDGRQRCQSCQRFKNFLGSDVARVNDVFGSAQGFDSFGAKQAVRVGNDTNSDEEALSLGA